ncbi:hypothetical protein ElyMa_004263300 [Elysia marginata]|uniref:Uncharacterized protein n=1 Tax=Elysia marginata TaxID=1093978 RepID=A0AAV4GTZ4_9GAST|nr:hypothetical protein ElyMa_004263300 [Elysia marginata]
MSLEHPPPCHKRSSLSCDVALLRIPDKEVLWRKSLRDLLWTVHFIVAVVSSVRENDDDDDDVVVDVEDGDDDDDDDDDVDDDDDDDDDDDEK